MSNIDEYILEFEYSSCSYSLYFPVKQLARISFSAALEKLTIL